MDDYDNAPRCEISDLRGIECAHCLGHRPFWKGDIDY